MEFTLRPLVALSLTVAVCSVSPTASTEIDTTKVREPVAPDGSITQTILYSPALLVKVPLKLLKGTARVGIKIAVEPSPMRLVLQKVFGSERPLHLLVSYGSKPSLEGGVGLRLRDLLKPGDQVLGHVEEAGRHFGMKVDETLIER